MEWGKTMLDKFAGIVLHVKVDPNYIRQNRHICGPGRKKIPCETPEGELPAVVLEGMFFRCKGPAEK